MQPVVEVSCPVVFAMSLSTPRAWVCRPLSANIRTECLMFTHAAQSWLLGSVNNTTVWWSQCSEVHQCLSSPPMEPSPPRARRLPALIASKACLPFDFNRVDYRLRPVQLLNPTFTCHGHSDPPPLHLFQLSLLRSSFSNQSDAD